MGKETRDFVHRNFYVNDRLTSCPTENEVITLIRNAQAIIFTFHVSLPEKHFTQRGVLSVINSVYDPLGFVSPVIVDRKLILQQIVIMGTEVNGNDPLGWDDPLPEKMKHC